MFGFWTASLTDCNDFYCCHLDSAWDLRKDPIFKDVLDQVPENSIPVSAK